MNTSRFVQLLQAKRLLDQAELLAHNGDHFAAAGKVVEARDLIFGSKQQASPAQPKVAGTNNTGSCGASLHHSLMGDATGHRPPGSVIPALIQGARKADDETDPRKYCSDKAGGIRGRNAIGSQCA